MKNIQTHITALLLTLTFFYTHAFPRDSEYGEGVKQLDNNRDRRESIVGLIPFPRVGRSGINSALQMDNLFETQKELKNHKREGLFAFPRVGRRSDPRNSALWFGPRLGRSLQVSDNLDADAPPFIKTLFEIKRRNIGDEDDNSMFE